jgi:LuxR family transcriptional regulator, maltose regulon positive regulatory protein
VSTRRSARVPVLSSKFALPPAPAAMMPRPRLTELLADADGPAVVSIVAPAGYGKTTLLRQWADQQLNAGYVSLEDRDNDPVELMSAIAIALDRVEPLDPSLMRQLASPGRSLESTLLPGLVEAIWARRTPTVLMLDDAHHLDRPVSLDVVAFLMLRLPPTMRLAVIARRMLPLPYARLRPTGHLLELGPQELALNEEDAQALAMAIGVEIPREQVIGLLARTEGWPAATYLGLRLAGSARAQDLRAHELTGTEASIADYMRSELLEPLDTGTRAWLRRSSVLIAMSGPLCDATLGTTGSLTLLRRLERDNLFVVALDTKRGTYRYHRLFRDLLRDELEEHEPGAAARMSSRAAAWCVQVGERERAVDYAFASGDMDLAARLVLTYTFPLHWSGRIATVGRWLDWFDRDGERERRAALAAIAGWVHAMEGRTREARRWLTSAERSADDGPMPDGATKASWVAVLRGYMAPAGLETLASDARIALAGIPEESPFRQGALILGGFAAIAAGAPEAADALFAEAIPIAEGRNAIPGISLALGERAVIALGRGDVAAATRHVESGLAVVRGAGMDEFVTSTTLHAAAARVALANGSPSEARLAIARVNRMRPIATAALPIPSLQMRFETIRACIVLGEAAAARTLLLEVKDILRQCPDLGALVDEAAELDRTVGSMRATSAGPWALTTAELRLLAYLPTHLTFREIADRLYVSTHTIKSQAMAIYGKLGVSSRRGAIEQAVESGLLDPSVTRMPGIPGGIG